MDLHEVRGTNPYGAFVDVPERPIVSEAPVSDQLAGVTIATKDWPPSEMEVPGLRFTMGGQEALLGRNQGGIRSEGTYVSTVYGTLAQLMVDHGAEIVANARASRFGTSNHIDEVINAFFAEYSAGGSTGGGATAVAVGLVAAALGGDGGRSIRLPAALNGLVGHKVSSGTLKQVRDRVYEFAVPGVLTDRLELLVQILNLMRSDGVDLDFGQYVGPSADAMPKLTIVRFNNPNYRPRMNQGGEDATIHPANRGALDLHQGHLERLEHEVIDGDAQGIPLPFDADECAEIAGSYMRRIGSAAEESRLLLADWIGRDPEPGVDFDEYNWATSTTHPHSDRHEVHDIAVMNEAAAQFLRFMDEHGFDMILTPTIRHQEWGPFYRREHNVSGALLEQFVGAARAGVTAERDLLYAAGMQFFPEAEANIWGTCATAIPGYYASLPHGKWFPVAAELIGRPGQDALNLGVVAQIEGLLAGGFRAERQKHLDLNGSEHWIGAEAA